MTVSGFSSRWGTFISVCDQPPRSTQPGHPFVGRRSEYQPKIGDSVDRQTDIICELFVASLPHKCQSSLPSARQHPSYGDCLEVKREYYQNCSVLGCVTQCSQSAAHSYEQFLQVQQIVANSIVPQFAECIPYLTINHIYAHVIQRIYVMLQITTTAKTITFRS